MPIFVRNIIGIVLVIGLSFVVGCESAKPGSKKTTSNAFALPWVEKEPEKADWTMQEVLRRDRGSSPAR